MAGCNLSPFGVAKMFSRGLSAQGMKELYDHVECCAMSASVTAEEGGSGEGSARRDSHFASRMLNHIEELGRKMEEEEKP